MNIGNMTIREYAKEHDIEIIGNLKRINDALNRGYRCYVDEVGTEIYINPRNGEVVICGEDWVF